MKNAARIKTSVLCVLFVVCFSTSYAVTFTSQYNGDGSFDIFYEGSLPVAMALDITLPDNLTTDYTLCNFNSYYNFFPDWAYDNPGQSQYLGAGHPIANPDTWGALETAASEFCVSMAAFTPHQTNLGLLDLDGDLSVNEEDLLAQNADWLCITEPPMLLYSDISMDGKVDMLDVGLMNNGQYLDPSLSGLLMTIEVHSYAPGANYGAVLIAENYRGVCEVPEPATVSLLAIGGLALMRKRKA